MKLLHQMIPRIRERRGRAGLAYWWWPCTLNLEPIVVSFFSCETFQTLLSMPCASIKFCVFSSSLFYTLSCQLRGLFTVVLVIGTRIRIGLAQGSFAGSTWTWRQVAWLLSSLGSLHPGRKTKAPPPEWKASRCQSHDPWHGQC